MRWSCGVPERSLMKATRDPSGDHAALLSHASWSVRLTSAEPSILKSRMSLQSPVEYGGE
jgi:hypothetical protein